MNLFIYKALFTSIGVTLFFLIFTSTEPADLENFTPTLINNEDIDEHFEKIEVWSAGEMGMEGYRLPGITITTHGTVLAFAEARVDYGDSTPNHIAMKRSKDGGLTWSKSIIIEESNGEYWKNHKNHVSHQYEQDKKEVWVNPTPVLDSITGRIFVFYALNEGEVLGQNLQRYSRVFYKYSDDDGLSWSDRIDITDILNANKKGQPNKDENGEWITDDNGFSSDYLGRAFHLPGPGHGIQLSGGRLLVQLWSRTALATLQTGIKPVEDRKYGLTTIYSDNHGATWSKGESFGHEGENMAESRMLELENKDIYVNSRYVSLEQPSSNYRITAISNDKGVSWTDIKVDKNFIKSNAVDAGLARFSSESKEGKNRILYSKVEDPDGSRRNLVVRLSYDEGKSWDVKKTIDDGSAKYSDLAVLPDKTILCLYETNKSGPLYIARFNLEWLTDSKDKSKDQ